jgi:hypothetical protein
MSSGAFVVAMMADIGVGRYDRPAVALRHIRRWTIISRFGVQHEYLTISISGGIAGDQSAAPIGLTPAKTALGILLSEDERTSECIFLLARHLPRDIKVAGSFFPADGYARLSGQFETLRVRSEGRHAHSRGMLNAQDVCYDIPNPAPGAKWAMSWHIDTIYRHWNGEFFSSGQSRP